MSVIKLNRLPCRRDDLVAIGAEGHRHSRLPRRQHAVDLMPVPQVQPPPGDRHQDFAVAGHRGAAHRVVVTANACDRSAGARIPHVDAVAGAPGQQPPAVARPRKAGRVLHFEEQASPREIPNRHATVRLRQRQAIAAEEALHCNQSDRCKIY